MVGPTNGGSLDRVHVEAGVPAISHFFHDLVPYLDCCLLSDNCGKYFEKRPSDDSSNYEPPRPGNGMLCWLTVKMTVTVMTKMTTTTTKTLRRQRQQ